jgi:ABC-type transport system involved in multi-copper enzyme maturation permease subunit
MSNTVAPPAVAPSPATTSPRRPSLARAEVHRFAARRLVRLLLALSALLFVGGVVLATLEFAQTSPQLVAEATERRQAALDEQERFRQECLAAPVPPDLPAGTTPEQICGTPGTIEQFGSVEDFLDKRPFTLDGAGRGGLLAVATATAGLAFLLGATYVGAEWSTRSMVALLFWEPRRRKVMATKLLVLAGASAALGVLTQAAWLLVGRYLLAATRGTTAVPDGTWGELIAGAGRGVLLVVLLGLLGFGIANLLRNTAASFGAAFVWFVIAENVLRGLLPASQPYLLTESAVALLTEGGSRVYVNDATVDGQGMFSGGREIVISNLHGGLMLAAVVAAVLALGVLLFVRRDLD